MHKVFSEYGRSILKTASGTALGTGGGSIFSKTQLDQNFPKQLLVLWGTRNCRNVRVNDFSWAPRIPIEIYENRAAFESIVASWYYDGNKMRDPFILDHCKTETVWDDHSGQIKMEGDEGVYSFGGSSADFWMDLNSEKVGIELSMQRWKDPMAELMPTGKNFFRNMGVFHAKIQGTHFFGKDTSRRC